MKIALTPSKPRSPLVAPAHFRRAGAHRPAGQTGRRQGARLLKRELDEMKHSP